MANEKLNTKKYGMITAAALISVVAIVIYCYGYSGIGAKISTQCKLNAKGEGECLFSNLGWTAGSACPWVGLLDPTTRRIAEQRFCSGRVWPSDTTHKTIFISLPAGHCRTIWGRSATCIISISESPVSGTTSAYEHPSNPSDSVSKQNHDFHDEMDAATTEAIHRAANQPPLPVINDFNPLVAAGQYGTPSCNADTCEHYQWVSSDIHEQDAETISIFAMVRFGESIRAEELDIHQPPTNSEHASEQVKWEQFPRRFMIHCSKIEPSIGTESLVLRPWKIAESQRSAAARYMEGCHSEFGDPSQTIAKYGYNTSPR